MNGKFCTGKGISCDGNMVSALRTFTRSPGDHLTTKYVTGHMLVDRRHCTIVCDVRSMRGDEMESRHF
jgi:hypothetical protein